MSEIKFETNVSWNGVGVNGKGEITLDDQLITYSSPAKMGGKGIGVSPEDLLTSAVTSCYSGTLFSILKKKGLSVQSVEVRAEGIVTGYPLQTRFDQLIVHPTIVGGVKSKQIDYQDAAETAKDNCFIGKSIAGNINYKVGTVHVSTLLLAQDKVDELVDRFYSKLTKDSYFSTMFAERNVDIENLKKRQKVFISRLVNKETHEEEPNLVEQVQERHSFQTTSKGSKIWIDIMEDTINDITLADEVKEILVTKIRFLLDNLDKK